MMISHQLLFSTLYPPSDLHYTSFPITDLQFLKTRLERVLEVCREFGGSILNAVLKKGEFGHNPSQGFQNRAEKLQKRSQDLKKRSQDLEMRAQDLQKRTQELQKRAQELKNSTQELQKRAQEVQRAPKETPRLQK